MNYSEIDELTDMIVDEMLDDLGVDNIRECTTEENENASEYLDADVELYEIKFR